MYLKSKGSQTRVNQWLQVTRFYLAYDQSTTRSNFSYFKFVFFSVFLFHPSSRLEHGYRHSRTGTFLKQFILLGVSGVWYSSFILFFCVCVQGVSLTFVSPRQLTHAFSHLKDRLQGRRSPKACNTGECVNNFVFTFDFLLSLSLCYVCVCFKIGPLGTDSPLSLFVLHFFASLAGC